MGFVRRGLWAACLITFALNPDVVSRPRLRARPDTRAPLKDLLSGSQKGVEVLSFSVDMPVFP